MPYAELTDLPEAVQKLPKHAQEIYLAAFNAAFEQYDGNEGKSHGTAWAAVKEKYKQNADEEWVAKSAASPGVVGFEFDAPINRVWKSADGSQMFFEGVASTTSVDTQKERTSDQCIKSMAGQVGLDLFNIHTRIAGQELGATISHKVADGALFVEAELFADNPEAVRIYNRMVSGKSYGLSIGGKVTAAHFETAKSGERIRVLDDIALHHMVITPNPSNKDTWTAIVAKSAEGIPEFETLVETRLEPLPNPDETAKVAVSDAAWDGKRSDFPKSAYLVQADNWTDCKLPVYEPDTSSEQDADGHYTKRGALNANGVRAALSAIAGGRTGKPMDVTQAVKDKLDTLAKAAGIEVAKDEGAATMSDLPSVQDAMPVAIVNDSANAVPIKWADQDPETYATDLAGNMAEVAEYAPDVWRYTNALEKTIKGIWKSTPDASTRQTMAMQALVDFTSVVFANVSAEVGKAGARHSAADVKMIHTAITALQAACGCDTCAGAVTKAEAPDKEAEPMPDEEGTAVEKTEVAEEPVAAAPAEETSEAVAEEEAVTEEETVTPAEPAVEPVDDAAKTAAEPAVEAAPTGDDVLKVMRDEMDALKSQLETQAAELGRLKALPAEGGPVSKVDGDKEVADTQVAKVDLVEEAAKAGDRPTFFLGLGAKMRGLDTTVTPPPQ